MAADLPFEGRLRGALRDALDAVEGPHPAWAASPARDSVAADGVQAAGRVRRPSRAFALLAAGLAVAVVGVALVAGGSFRPSPGPGPSNRLVGPAASPLPTPSPSEAAIVAPSPVAAPSASPCVTTWSHAGTYPKGGLQDGSFLWELGGDGGQLSMKFLNSIDTVKQISIVTVSAPPLRDSSGRRIHVEGAAFFKLVIEGLTRATEITRDDMKPNDGAHGPGISIVQAPIAEARRIQKPAHVSRDANQSEIWILGLDFPACLSVRTVRDASSYEVSQPGDNYVIVSFERQFP